MEISLNGELQLVHATSIALLIQEVTPQAPFVIAVNGDFVPKPEYEITPINPGDKEDIVVPVFGG